MGREEFASMARREEGGGREGERDLREF